MTVNSDIYSDFIDLEFFQVLQDKLAKEFGIASIIVDEEGTPLTVPSNFTNFCEKYIRNSEEGLKKCMACDAYGGNNARNLKKPVIYRCHAGLIDFASPIIIEDITIGYFLCGQILDKRKDRDEALSIAGDLGIPSCKQKKFLEALEEVRVVPYEKIEAIAQLVYRFSYKMSKFAYYQDKINKSNINKRQNINKLEEISRIFDVESPPENTENKIKYNTVNFLKKLHKTTCIKIDYNEKRLNHISRLLEKFLNYL